MYKVNDERVFCDVANGQVVIIDFTTGTYYGNASLFDGYVLQSLTKGYAPEAISAKVAMLEGSPDDFPSTLDAYVSMLLEKGILIASDEDDGASEELPALPDFEFVPDADDFTLELQEFTEIQELLLADPIHEADIDAGWPVFKDEG